MVGGHQSNAMFEELDYRPSPIGTLVLRRRRLRPDSEPIYEIKLDDGYLMSSHFVEGEIALARLALEGLAGRPLNIVVGGLGLGYTAKAALDHAEVAELIVVEAIPEVVEWHQRHLVPLGKELTERCTFRVGDFFSMAAGDPGFDPKNSARRFDAILVDIDHSPRHLLAPQNAHFYSVKGIEEVCQRLDEGGVFGLWSTDPPDEDYLVRLQLVFPDAYAQVVEFPNPYQEKVATNTIYIARKAVSR